MLEVGEKVLVLTAYDRNERVKNKIGTIIGYDDNGSEYAIEFPENIHGHDCNDLGTYGYCWFVAPDVCQLVAIKNTIKSFLYKKENKDFKEVEWSDVY